MKAQLPTAVWSQTGGRAGALENDGKPQACGWIIDKYGVRWQIVPIVLRDMITHPDKTKAKRAAEEMLKQGSRHCEARGGFSGQLKPQH